MSRPKDLPEFDSPPVVETVLSVQFEKLAEMRAAHFGLFWAEIREQFPQTEERSTLEPTIEVFPAKAPRGLGIKLESSDRPPIPRVWYASIDGNSLIQLQPDRLIRNWRKVGGDDTYPRYEKVREDFEKDFRRFVEFARSNKLGEIRVNQCEVTYVNHIVAGEGWSELSEAAHIFNFLSFPGGLPGKLEDLTLHTALRIMDSTNKPVGRLHVEISPGVQRMDGVPMYRFSLTARGLVGDGLDFFDTGRDQIVRTFTELTTAKMHRIWRRRD